REQGGALLRCDQAEAQNSVRALRDSAPCAADGRADERLPGTADECEARDRRQHQPRSRCREAAGLVQVDDLEREDQSIAEVVDCASSLKNDDGPRQTRPPAGERTWEPPAH